MQKICTKCNFVYETETKCPECGCITFNKDEVKKKPKPFIVFGGGM